MSRCCDAAVPVLTLRTCLGPGSEAAGQLARESSLNTVTAEQVSTQTENNEKTHNIKDVKHFPYIFLRKVSIV